MLSPVLSGIIGVILLMVFMFALKLPIGFAMTMGGIIGIVCYAGVGGELANIVSSMPYAMSTEYVLVAIPFFVMMGWFIAESGISEDLFIAGHRWLGWIRGGLAMAVVVANAILSAVITSSVVAAATITPIALKEMRKYKYSDKLSLGVNAASATLGPLIPPSIFFVVYGFITETSIAHLFTAGIGSGAAMSLMFMAITYVWCLIDPKVGPASPRAPFRDWIKLPLGMWMCIIIMIVCLGGLYTGWATATESGALGAFISLVCGLASKRLKWRGFINSMRLTCSTTGMIFLLIIGSMIFSSMIALSTIPHMLVELLANYNRWFILSGLIVVLIILGTAMDIMGIVIIVVPALWPSLMVAGFDPVWLGVLICVTVMIADVSPPFGLTVFVISAIVKEVPQWDIFMGSLPYLVAMIVTLIILIIFPDISLYLVRVMYD